MSPSDHPVAPERPQGAEAGAPGHADTHQHTHAASRAVDACCGHDHGPNAYGHAPRPFDPAALISARGLKITRSGRVILDHVDLDIRPGEIVTLIGPNGAGKSTLVKALLGLESLDQGERRPAPGLTLGYVPQRFDVDPALPMTVERFLGLGRRAGTGRAAAVLEEVGAARVRTRQLSEISGGELQRVLLARALLADPQLLVLDEPVQGVDYQGEAELYTLIGKLRETRGLGVLLVSHDLHVVMGASDRVICLNRHVCCSGVPETVAQHPEYARLFGPESARAFAVYHHHHDHRHDLAGEPAVGGEPRRD